MALERAPAFEAGGLTVVTPKVSENVIITSYFLFTVEENHMITSVVAVVLEKFRFQNAFRPHKRKAGDFKFVRFEVRFP